MNKTIIAVYGKQDEGKSKIIKNVCQILLNGYLNAVPTKIPNYSADISLAIQLSNIKIGLQSYDDLNTLEKLVNNKFTPQFGDSCDIIICAIECDEVYIKNINTIANKYNYNTIWMSSYFSRKLNNSVLNSKAAENIVDIIKSLIVEEL